MAQDRTATESSLAVKIFKYWLPVLIMLGAMYQFSTDVFSGENTRDLVEIVLGWFLSDPGRRLIQEGNYLVRKSAHFIEYAMLAALLFRAFRADSPLRWRLSWTLYSLAIVVSWALLDELHQSFTRKRGGSLYDVLLDSTGGFFMLLVIYIFNRPRRRPRSKMG